MSDGKYYLGGYYLAQQNLLLPHPILTISSCLNTIFPAEWALEWVQTNKEEKEKIKQELKISEQQYKKIQQWCTQSFEQEFEWPNIFSIKESARQIYSQFFSHLNHVKLLGLYLPEENLERMLEYLLGKENIGYGIYKQLQKKIIEEKKGKVIGFDILGFEVGGSPHCFACNGLEKDYKEKFGIIFNEHGLFSSYEDGEKVIDYTNDEKTRAEPVLWSVWKVKEFAL